MKQKKLGDEKLGDENEQDENKLKTKTKWAK